MAKKKSNIKILGIVFLLLLLIVVIMLLGKSGKSERSFRSMVIEPDTVAVDVMEIISKNDQDAKIVLSKENSQWFVEQNGEKYRADNKIVQGLLGNLSNLKTERVAATKAKNWKKFEVTDSMATRVKLMGDGDIVSDIMIGKFNFKQIPSTNPYQRQPQTKTNTFVRRSDDETVYSVDGFLRMSFQPTISSYRDKNLVSKSPNDINRLTFSYPADSGYVLQKQGGQWMIDGLKADSASAARFVNKISRMMSGDFEKDATSRQSETPALSLKIEGNNFNPIVIEAFPADSSMQYIINSTANPGSWFNGRKNGLWEKIFISRNELMNQ